MATQKMDISQMFLGIFLLGALGVAGAVALVSKIDATVDPAGYAAQQAQVAAVAKAAQDAKDASDAEQARADAEKVSAKVADADSANGTDVLTSHDLARVSLVSVLKDPDSARFKDVQVYRDAEGGTTLYVFCGEVTAKNSFGAFDGYERFIATPLASTLESGASDFEDAWAKFCPASAAEPMPVPF
jgi:hypothetical protein